MTDNKVSAQKIIDQLIELTQKYGDLTVRIYLSPHVQYEVGSVNACTNRDHILVTLGPLVEEE